MVNYKLKRILILVLGKTEYRFFIQLKRKCNDLDKVFIKSATNIEKIIKFLNGDFLSSRKYRKYEEIHIVYDREGIYYKNQHSKEEDKLIKNIKGLIKKSSCEKVNNLKLEYKMNIQGSYTKFLLIPSNPSFEYLFYLILKNSDKKFNMSEEIEKELSKISKTKYSKSEKNNQKWLDKIIFNDNQLENTLKNAILKAKKGFERQNDSYTLTFKTIEQILINAKRYK